MVPLVRKKRKTPKCCKFDTYSIFKTPPSTLRVATFTASPPPFVCVPLIVKTSFDNLFYNLFEKMGVGMKILFTDGIYSKVAVSFVIIILNYVFSKLIVFKNKKTEK